MTMPVINEWFKRIQTHSSPQALMALLSSLPEKIPFLHEPRQNTIGLGIGHRNLIAVELDTKETPPRLKRIVGKEFASETALPPVAVIQELMTGSGFPHALVNTSLSGQSVIVRFIKFPKMSEKELRGALEFEVEKYIPFDVSQVYLDFDVLYADENRKYLELVLVVAKKNVVQELLDACKGAGLSVKMIDIDAFACFNTFLAAYPEETTKTVALINVGAKVTNLMITHQGMPAFSRDIYFAGDDVTNAIAKKMHLDLRVAETLKFDPGEYRTQVHEVLQESLLYLLTEMKLSFDYFESQGQKEKRTVQTIYLTGGSSKLDGVNAIVADKFKLPVIELDPLRAVTVDATISQSVLNQYMSSLAVPIGLALRK